MIDPSDVIKFDRTQDELEEWWLFSCVVAGKTAKTQARLLEDFLQGLGRAFPGYSPFGRIKLAVQAGVLEGYLRQSHLGQYSRLTRCFEESLRLDLANDPVEAFEAIHGVGPKTARMFIMHSRPGQRLAAIDTHVLKFLAANGHTVPKATPGSAKQYRELEEAFLVLADEAGQTPSDFDLAVWKRYAAKPTDLKAA